MRSNSLGSMVLLASLLALGFAASITSRGPVIAHEENPSEYSYYEHVLPILTTHCGGCHRPEGVGPMSLLGYEDAIPWANAMKLQLLEGTMPPWLPDDGSAALRHARSLTPEELNILVDWAAGQTPEGAPTEASIGDAEASPPTMMDDMDRVLTLDQPVALGEDDYELDACVVFPTGLEDPKALSRILFEPGEGRTILRSAVGFVGESCDPAGRAVFSWLPDRSEANLVAQAEPLDPGARLAVALTYRKGWREDGVAISDSPRLGLEFVDPSVSPIRVSSELVDETRHVLDGPMRLAAVFPVLDAESAGRPFELVVHRADGTEEVILSIEAYSPEWREKYILSTPRSLARGDEIRLSAPSVWLDFLPEASPAAE